MDCNEQDIWCQGFDDYFLGKGTLVGQRRKAVLYNAGWFAAAQYRYIIMAKPAPAGATKTRQLMPYIWA